MKRLEEFIVVSALGLLVAGAVRASAEELAVAAGREVSFEYTVRLKDKTVVGSNVGKDPVTYVHGRKQIIPGLEKALAGMKAGQSKHVEVPASEAYGPYDETARLTIDRSQVPPDTKPGTTLATHEGRPVKVLEVREDKVVIDLNHPLAGKDLVFDVKVLKVAAPQPASEQNQPEPPHE